MRFKEGRRQSKQQNSTRLHKGGKYEKRKGEKGPTWTAFEKRAPLLSSQSLCCVKRFLLHHHVFRFLIILMLRVTLINDPQGKREGQIVQEGPPSSSSPTAPGKACPWNTLRSVNVPALGIHVHQSGF